MQDDIFQVIIFIGRPASGKSEILDYLIHLPPDERKRRYHVGDIDVIDDFPMLWTWFEEDNILSQVLGQPRLHTDENEYFKNDYLWHLLIERIGLEYCKRLRDNGYHHQTTTLIEFSRGSEHGGYREAFQHLPYEVLRAAGIVYVNVSYQESRRKDRLRYNPNRPDSILEHSLKEEKMERLYRHDDWFEFSMGENEHIVIDNTSVPYVIFENEDNVTSGKPDQLGERLEKVLLRLWSSRRG